MRNGEFVKHVYTGARVKKSGGVPGSFSWKLVVAVLDARLGDSFARAA